jgi:hypothetical protein
MKGGKSEIACAEDRGTAGLKLRQGSVFLSPTNKQTGASAHVVLPFVRAQPLPTSIPKNKTPKVCRPGCLANLPESPIHYLRTDFHDR